MMTFTSLNIEKLEKRDQRFFEKMLAGFAMLVFVLIINAFVFAQDYLAISEQLLELPTTTSVSSIDFHQAEAQQLYYK